ncbi:MFS transporter [Streptosporangium sp. KLBMP 9127]|nr:MFS transporter [Streptosporangium sp. KLBMP 9127]
MALAPYKRILALPGMRVLMAVGLVARVPYTASALTLTLHVTADRGFLDAGIVTAAVTLGMAVGSPLAGRLIDARGLRPILAVCAAAQCVFWFLAPFLPYPVLVPAALVAGVLSLPVFGVIRQCVAAMVPADQRRTGFALDSMAVELSYIVGPALAVAGVTTLGGPWTMRLVGAGLVGSGIALILLNPPTRSEAEIAQLRVPRRTWLRPGLVALLASVSALTLVLTATELSLVATLTKSGDLGWTGLVIGLWCAYSLVGGFVYGALSRSVSPLLLIGGLCVLTAPLGLVGGGWWWLCLALIPAGLLCAPALAATVDAVSSRTPGSARGEVMGLHSTALTIGVAAAGPLAGGIIDGHGPGWAFVVTGLVAVVVVLVAVPFVRAAVPEAPAPATEPVSA